jgi:hypothetical protein
MYANDAVIFLKPTPMDVDNLKCILLNFGGVTGLQTNLQKTSVTPISCNDIDLDSLLANLPLTRAAFPIKYLGLPLTQSISSPCWIRRLVSFPPGMVET